MRLAGQPGAEHSVPGVSGAEPGISGDGAERRRKMAVRDNPKAGGKRRREKCCPDPVFGIDVPAHVKVAPNPGAAPITAAVRPAFSISSGTATSSSNGHSCVRNAQASSGSWWSCGPPAEIDRR